MSDALNLSSLTRFFALPRLVRMRCFFLVPFLLLAISVYASVAKAEQVGAASSQSASNCGATTADALKQARASFADNKGASEHAALGCLIEAVTRLEGEQPFSHRGADQHPTIAVPKIDHADLSSNASAPLSAVKGKE